VGECPINGGRRVGLNQRPTADVLTAAGHFRYIPINKQFSGSVGPLADLGANARAYGAVTICARVEAGRPISSSIDEMLDRQHYDNQDAADAASMLGGS